MLSRVFQIKMRVEKSGRSGFAVLIFQILIFIFQVYHPRPLGCSFKKYFNNWTAAALKTIHNITKRYSWVEYYQIKNWDDDLRLKNHFCENGNYSRILQEFDFFLLFFNFSQFFLFDNIPLKNIFSMSTNSQFNSNSIKG